MGCLMLLTVLVSILLVISHSTPFVEPLRFDDESVLSLDINPISDLNQPLFGTESLSPANGEIGSALEQCDGSTGGLPSLGKGKKYCPPGTSNDETVDESTLTIPHLLNKPNKYAPTSDDNDCKQFLQGKFLIVDGMAIRFKWSVCDSGKWDTSPVDVTEASNDLLPGYTTYTLYDASLCKFIKVQDVM